MLKRPGFFLKIVIILIFISPFLYTPIQWINNQFLVRKFSHYQPLSPEKFLRREKFYFVPFSECANADYHRNPFVPSPTSGSNHFPDLDAGIYQSGKIPFQILEPFSRSRRSSVITTGENPYFTCQLPLFAKASNALHLFIGGAWISDKVSRLVRIEIFYEDGTKTGKILMTNRDVWTYRTEPERANVSPKQIMWQSKTGQKITSVFIPLDPKRTPKALEVSTMPAMGKEGKQPAVAIFSVTQEFVHGR